MTRLRLRNRHALVTPPEQFSTARPTSFATTRTVTTLAQWNQALADLASGVLSDAGNCRIAVSPGLNLSGMFTLPVRPVMTGWVEISTDLSDSTIANGQGTRMTPSQASSFNLASLELPSGVGGLAFADGAQGYRVSMISGVCSGTHTGLWRTGTLSTFTDMSKQTSRAVFDRVYLPGLQGQSQRRGLALTGRYQAVVDSWITDFYDSGSDSQAVAIYGSEGPYKIDNNRLDGWSEVLLVGGAHPDAITDIHEVPSDITITRNFITKKCELYQTDPLYDREKNLIELKSARRVLIEKNVVEHSQNADQSGSVLLLKSTDQTFGAHPLAGVQDVEVRGNKFRLAGTGFYLIDTDGASPNCNKLHRVYVHDNLTEDLNSTSPYLTLGRPWQIFGQIGEIYIEHNTDVRSGNTTSMGVYYDGDVAATGVIKMRSNIISYGSLGVFRNGSTLHLDSAPYAWPVAGSACDYELLVGSGATDPTTVSPLPGTNTLARTSDNGTRPVGYVDYAGRDYTLSGSSLGHLAAHDGLDIGISNYAAFTAGLAGV